MKKLFIAAIMLFSLGVNNSNSQTIVRNGNVFQSQGRTTHRADTLVTTFKFESGGTQYPIIINKASGRCYIWKPSGRTGKLYKMYMKPEVSQAVCRELNIEYKPSRR
jgi:hypothetical protein